MREPIIKYNHWLPAKCGAVGMTLYPFILIKYSKADVGNVLMHEMIHWGQIQKDGVLKFYFMYGLYWAFNMWKYKFDTYKAYMNIPYEVEAYEKAGG